MKGGLSKALYPNVNQIPHMVICGTARALGIVKWTKHSDIFKLCYSAYHTNPNIKTRSIIKSSKNQPIFCLVTFCNEKIIPSLRDFMTINKEN